MSKYKITLFTGNVDNAGTDAEVFITIFGTSGKTREFILDNPGNDREQGDNDTYFVEGHNVGKMTSVRIRHDNSGDRPGWFLDKIEVTNEDADRGKRSVFPYFNWLAKDEGDGQIERLLKAQ